MLWVIFTAVILAGSYVLPGIIVSSFGLALALSATLGAILTFVKPFLEPVMMPMGPGIYAMTMFFINAGLLTLAVYFIPGFRIVSFWPALILSLVLSLITYVNRETEPPAGLGSSNP